MNEICLSNIDYTSYFFMKCSECSEVGGDMRIGWLRREAQNEENTAIKSNENRN